MYAGQIQLVPSDAPYKADEYFGRSVHVDGSIAIVGSSKDEIIANGDEYQGVAYLYDAVTGNRLDVLVSDEYVGAGSPTSRSVWLRGNRALVGRNGGLYGFGHLFDVNTGQQIQLFVPPNSTSREFRTAVAMNDQIAVIGDYRDDDGGEFAGAAYLFDIQSGQQLMKISPDDVDAGDRFGQSIAIDESIIVVGSVHDDDNGTDSGAAYLFDATTGMQLLKLLPIDGAPGDKFGGQVDIDGSTVIVDRIKDIPPMSTMKELPIYLT